MFAELNESLELIEDNVTANVWRFTVAADYYNWPRWRQGRNWSYHCYSGLGIAHHSMSGEYVVRDKSSNEIDTIRPSSRDIVKFMLALGFTAMTKIHDHVGLEGAFEFDGVAIGTNPNAYSDYTAIDYAFIVDFKIGVVWLF